MKGTFCVEHVGMERGIYLCDVLRTGIGEIVIFDIRMKRPYEEKTYTVPKMHTLEHVVATALNNVLASYKDIKKVYWGPMGCETGFYLILWDRKRKIKKKPRILGEILVRAIGEALTYSETPAKDKHMCGNVTTLTDIEAVKGELTDILIEASKVKRYNSYSKYTYIE